MNRSIDSTVGDPRMRTAEATTAVSQFEATDSEAWLDAPKASGPAYDQAVLRLHGASRFTTWAYKFALLEAGVRMRKRAWQEREMVLDSDSWSQLAQTSTAPDADAEIPSFCTRSRTASPRS